MWLITPVGFFSVVQKPADVAAGTLTVRSRVRSDLDALRAAVLPELTPTKETTSSDYRFRAQAPKTAVAAALAKLAESIDYSNFKDVVAQRQGKERAHLYHGVWDVLYAMQGNPKYDNPVARPTKAKAAPSGLGPVPKADAYGGVLIDKAGRVLLREPTNHFGGYVWTFAKGRIDKGETPEQAALREVREETGYDAKIRGFIPKVFDGTTSSTVYFLMTPVGEPGAMSDETAKIVWVSFDDASKLISLTKMPKGRERDLAVLQAVKSFLNAADVNSPRLPRNSMFDVLAHADWSIAAEKRWMCIARRLDGQWRVEAPEVISNCAAFVAEVVAPTSQPQRRLIGFDFPIGVPASYGTRTGFQSFRELLTDAGSGEWIDFFSVAATPDEVSLRRPFYPQRSNNGAKRFHLLEALEVESIDELLRQCERRTADRNAACSLFWTLGAQQVGKAAISGWQEVVRPALARGVRLWPFDGRLGELSAREGSVICETYPAEAYGHVGVHFGPAESKRRQADRASKATAISAWAAANGVVLSESALSAVQSGFGSSGSGEDAFDSLVGLLGMIEVVDGRRGEGPTEEADVQRWEGWILGQTYER